jgi:hydroxymethylbilane synthase
LQLRAAGQETERVEIKTTGDLNAEVPLARIGSRALFTKQIDDALLDGRIDLAVHSLKDLPTQLPAGIVIGAIGAREDPRDALVGRGPLRWSDLPRGGTIGTSSLRRRAQLLNLRPDLALVDLRGNVGTRLAKLDANPEWTGILLATAGMVRLGLEGRIGERLSLELMLPAPGQGALAVTVRADDQVVAAVVGRAVHDLATALPVSAERAFLRRLEGGCQVPVASYGELKPGGGKRAILDLRGRVVSAGGESLVEGRRIGSAADEESAAALGTELAEQVLVDGAGAILVEARAAGAPVVTEP